MHTAQKIVADPCNSINGEVMHYRIASAADAEVGVIVSGSRDKPFYKFADGSGLSVYHTSGDFKVWGNAS